MNLAYRTGRALAAYPDVAPIPAADVAALVEQMHTTGSNTKRLLLRRWISANIDLLAFAGTPDDGVAWPLVVEWRAARAALGAAR
jgi:hypothetical protein